MIDFSYEKALNIGKAAEHLVCCDLLLSGYQVFDSDQGLSYDLILDHFGLLFKIQVKACMRPRNMNSQGRVERIGYSFFARRRGKNGQSRLQNNQCDIVAFVALDIRKIAYIPIEKVGTTMQFSPPDFIFSGKKHVKVGRITDHPIEKALNEITKK